MWRRLWCWITFHDVEVVQQFSSYARKVHCRRCDQYFAMNDDCCAFLPWDDDFEELYVAHGHGYGGRTLR